MKPPCLPRDTPQGRPLDERETQKSRLDGGTDNGKVSFLAAFLSSVTPRITFAHKDWDIQSSSCSPETLFCYLSLEVDNPGLSFCSAVLQVWFPVTSFPQGPKWLLGLRLSAHIPGSRKADREKGRGTDSSKRFPAGPTEHFLFRWMINGQA